MKRNNICRRAVGGTVLVAAWLAAAVAAGAGELILVEDAHGEGLLYGRVNSAAPAAKSVKGRHFTPASLEAMLAEGLSREARAAAANTVRRQPGHKKAVVAMTTTGDSYCDRR